MTVSTDSAHSSEASAAKPEAGTQQAAASIEAWLTTKVATLIGVSPRGFSADHSFQEWGLDSVALVSLTGELEDWLCLELSPALLYEHPTIKRLAAYLATLDAARRAQ